MAYRLILEKAEPLISPRMPCMFICIYLCNVMHLSVPQTQQKSLKMVSSNEPFRPAFPPLTGLFCISWWEYLLRARWVRDGLKLAQDVLDTACFPATSFPPSFFPLNCNLLPLLPLCVAGMMPSVSPSVQSAFLNLIRKDGKRVIFSQVSTHTLFLLPPPLLEETTGRKSDGEMFTEWMFACSVVALLS